MRAILAGITGVQKDIVFENLKQCMAANGMDTLDDRHLYHVSLEDRMGELGGGTFTPLLSGFNPQYQVQLWRRAGQSILEELTTNRPDHALMSMHITCYAQGRLFSLIDLQTLQQFRPDFIITLIDDVLDIWGTIVQRDRAQGTHFRLRLRELLAWRSAEITFGDFLARALSSDRRVSHYVVAVKHPATTLYRLLLSSDGFARIYAAFPITSTRDDKDSRQEIDDTRAELHERFLAFDPLTLDEDVPAVFELAAGTNGGTVTIDESTSRWPIPLAGTLLSGAERPYPITIEKQELLDVRDDIKQQVRIRDYTLIDQSSCVAGYRPKCDRRLSQGMIAEFQYAVNTAQPPRPVIVYSPPDDGGTAHPFLMGLFQNRHDMIDSWHRAIQQFGA